MGLKDNLNKNSQTVTITTEDKSILEYMNKLLQVELDMIQQRMAARFLNYLAVTKFDFDDTNNLHFNYDPEKEIDNLVITEEHES